MIIELDKDTKLEVTQFENDEGMLDYNYNIIQDWGIGIDVVVLDVEAARKLVSEINQDFLRKGL